MISSRKIRAAFSLVTGVALVACSSANLDEEAGGVEVGFQRSELWDGRLDSVRVFRLPTLTTGISALDSQNALPSGTLSDPTLRGLLVPLGNKTLNPSTPEVLALNRLPTGKILLKYLARCALREGDPSLSTLYPGRLGLAPAWTKSPLSPTEKRWITACLMAHSNDLASVPIAVSGTLPVFGSEGFVTAEPYRIEEAAFYGDIFKGQGMFTCSGAGTQALCADRGVSADLQRRICGTRSASECGFTYMGECNKLNGGTLIANACATAVPADSPYSSCRGAHETRYNEVITTSLRTDVDALGLHPRCTQPAAPSCSHGVCALGGPLAGSCNATTARVCASDDYCCTIAWDSVCAAAAGCPPLSL